MPWGPTAQDKAIKAKIDARNQLETYCYNMKSTVEDKMKDKISEEDKQKVSAAVKEALEWLEENTDAGGCCWRAGRIWGLWVHMAPPGWGRACKLGRWHACSPPCALPLPLAPADADEYKDKLKEVEDVCNPVISAAYGAAGGAGGGEGGEEDLGDHDEL